MDAMPLQIFFAELSLSKAAIASANESMKIAFNAQPGGDDYNADFLAGRNNWRNTREIPVPGR